MPPVDRARAKRRVLAVVFLTVFLDMIGYGVVIPLMPLYVQSMGGSARTVGVLFSCFAGAQLLATPLLGRLSDRYGRRRVILVSLAGNALSMIVFALATKVALLPLLFASRILAGATAGNLSACQAAIADVTTKEERAEGMGRLGAGIGLGLVLGPVLGGAASHFGTSFPPLAAAAMALVDLGLAFFLMPETRKPSPEPELSAGTYRTAPAPARPSPWRGLYVLVRDPRLGPVLGVYFLVFFALTNMQVSFALMTKERLGWSESYVGYSFALLGLIQMLVQLGLIGRLAKLFGEMRLLMGGALCIGAGMLMLSEAFSNWVVIVACSIFGLGMGVSTPALSSLASRFAPEDRQGEVLGVAQSAGGLARLIGPTWSGFLFASLGARAPFLGGAIAAGCSLLFTLYLQRKAGPERTPA